MSRPNVRSNEASLTTSRTARSGGFLKQPPRRPHQVRGRLTSKPDPEFETKCVDICAVYVAAPDAAEQGIRTVSIDEMSGVQALERAAPSLPMKPDKIERREHEYKRHGTQILIAAFDIATGQIQGTVGDTQTEDDYVSFLEVLFASSSATTQWRVVCDNLNTHVLEGVAPPGGPAMRD